ncbi:MAG: hypothetical protein EBZ24_12630, partial [Synechococcaceae bacterium WB9_4xB_025]|nr:hypothetical protein [Synechococcaceae bacterium WB9_4xB_025]
DRPLKPPRLWMGRLSQSRCLCSIALIRTPAPFWLEPDGPDLTFPDLSCPDLSDCLFAASPEPGPTIKQGGVNSKRRNGWQRLRIDRFR